MKMKIYKPLHSYPTLAYQRWVLLRLVTHAKVAAWVTKQTEQGGLMDTIIRVYQIG